MIKGRVLIKKLGLAGVFLIMMGFWGYCYVYAGDFERLDSRGLEGRKPLSISSDETGGQVVWVGTDGGIFRKELSKNGAWQKIVLEDVADVRVNRIEFSSYVPFGYAATSKGVYEIDPVSSLTCKIYSSDQDAENECYGVAVDVGQNIYIATKGGLFVRPGKGKRWTKSIAVLGNKTIDYVYAAGTVLYVAASDGLYRSRDKAKTWEKVFSLSTGSSREEAAEDEEENAEEGVSNRIYAAMGEKGTPSTIYLATSLGGFRSRDEGETWESLPLTGLDSKGILDLILSVSRGALYAATKNGVFRMDGDGWSVIAPLNACHGLVLINEKIFVATSMGIYAFEVNDGNDEIRISINKDTKQDSEYEPTIQEVQQMVIRYCDVSNDKIASWHKEARVKAFLPDLSFGYGNNVYGSYNGIFAVGPNDWQVNLSWELGDLIYSPDQTSIDVRSRLMVQLRNDVLAEATQLYYERKRLLIELSDGFLSSEDLSKRKIRLEEVSALLDRLTGGTFSKVLKSSP
ncbi:glycosyl hydrolase, BNR repeat precursor [Candidatus Velamenicoccus archaeovorus]|uniref:Glycosyl hydrolase, BNR repeat n=1 Tax=Velamenicoccus archaeovorus TaxID=1930593 RepID=A0A410P3Z3_VELA1|nr:glycosyl hydrolase, BNR repeat precursor [Candidatus Velamenicoccus archaeovorus]